MLLSHQNSLRECHTKVQVEPDCLHRYLLPSDIDWVRQLATALTLPLHFHFLLPCCYNDCEESKLFKEALIWRLKTCY
jgi:hypothetical protein